MAVSTNPPISSSFWFSSSNSTVKCRTAYSSRLAKSSRDVIFGFLAGGSLEDYVRAVVLDHAAQQEEARVVRDARGLLHVVSDNDHGALVHVTHNRSEEHTSELQSP